MFWLLGDGYGYVSQFSTTSAEAQNEPRSVVFWLLSDGSFCLVVMNAFLDFCSTSPDSQIIVVMLTCPLCYAQGSDTEGRADGASDSETKADTGIPDVPVPADDTPEVLNKALSGLSSR